MLLSSQFNQLTAHVITAVFMLKAADAERLLASRNDVVKNSLSKQSVILSELICEQPVFRGVCGGSGGDGGGSGGGGGSSNQPRCSTAGTSLRRCHFSRVTNYCNSQTNLG